MSVSEISKSIFILFFFILLWSCQSTTNTTAKEERTLDWQFPLKRTHTGMLLGNGVQGLMIWGYENKLNITIGRAGFWIIVVEMIFLPEQPFRMLKKCCIPGMMLH